MPVKRKYKRRGRKPASTIKSKINIKGEKSNNSNQQQQKTNTSTEKIKKPRGPRGPYKKKNNPTPCGYKCPICGKYFTYQWVLSNHINTNHKKSRQPKEEFIEPKCEPASPVSPHENL